MKDSDGMRLLGKSIIHVNVSPVGSVTWKHAAFMSRPGPCEGSKLMFTQFSFGVANTSEQSQQNHSSS